MREHDPVHYSPEQETWYVSRYEDVIGIGRSKDLAVKEMRPRL